MNKSRKTLLIITLLTMLVVLAFIVITNRTNVLKGLNLLIFALIIIGGVIAFVSAYKKDKEEKAGLTAEDELSTLIKYKSGYYAYMVSLYMWLFIFLFKDKFPDIETMLGGGILLSALIGYISKIVAKQKLND